MRKVTLVRGARQLLTLRGPSGPRRGADLKNLGLIQDGAVLIVDGLIQQVGSARRLENLALARQAEEIDASGCVVMPGFVDSNTHLIAGSARAIQDISPRTLERLAVRALEEAVRHGTTTVEAKSGLGLTEAGEMKILRVHGALRKRPISLISTFLCARVSPDFEERPNDYVEWVCGRVLPSVRRHNLAEFADIRCEAGGFTVDQVCRYLTTARRLGFALKVHTGSGSNSGAIRTAVELEAASVDHAIEATEDDAVVLAQSRTVATLLPGAVFFGGTERYAPARMLIDNGAAVALATNYNPETSPSQNMQMVMALACRSMNMTPAEALTAATMNAAHAIGQAANVGSLEIGKSADLLILGVSDYREISYHFGINLMDRVMKRGEVLVERSEVKWPAH
jgi:imidazolonepropionase